MQEDEEYFDEQPESYMIEEDEPQEEEDDTGMLEVCLEERKPVETIPLQEVSHRVEMLLHDLTEVIATSEDWALVFLQHCKWNRQKVETDYFTSNLKEKCGYTENRQMNVLTPAFCEICETNCESFWVLGCEHLSCVDCCRGYVEFNINRGDTFFKCMHACCETPFLRSTILTIIDKKDALRERYFTLLGKAFVEHSSNLRCCTSGGCTNILVRNDTSLKEVECLCKTKQCWDCGQTSHHPSTCDQVKHWRVAVIQEPSAMWLKRNTSICPNCNILIERIGGCSHMTCLAPKGCGTQFCYVCSEEWKFRHKNPYYCPNHKYKSGSVTIRQRKIFEIINVNFSHYTENDVRMQKLEKMWQQCRQVQDLLFELLSIDYFETSFLEVYLKSAINIHNTLKWSYTLAHYANTKNPMKEIYTYQQASAQKAGDLVYNLFVMTLRKFLTSIDPPIDPNVQYEEEYQPEKPAIDVLARREEFLKLKDELIRETKAAEVYQQALVKTPASDLTN